LLALHAVADAGSFHKAGAHLGYTQSAISQQIAALERLVGERLVERPGGSRPVRLTLSGELLLRHADAVFSQIAAAQADLAAHHAGRSARLRVGAFQSVGATLLPALMTRLAQRRPALEIELTQAISDDELFGRLSDGALDVTFATLPVPEGPFTFTGLFAEPFLAVVSATSPLAGDAGSVTLRELASYPLITARHCRYTADLKTLMRERGLTPNVAHRSDDNATVIGLVRAGAGVALMPRLAAESAGPGVQLLRIEEHLPPRRVGLAWRPGRFSSAVRETFAVEVAETCRQLGLAH
jgi:DNA-binding transcriptional LysR family regulator